MGEGWRSHFPSKDEQRWLRRAGRLGVVVVGVRLHPLPCYSPFTGRGARTGHSHGCFKRWRDRCLSTVSGPRLLSLSDSTTNCLLLHNPLPLSRPTACLYWLISLFFSLSIFTPLTVAFSLPSSFANSSSAIPAFFCSNTDAAGLVFVWCTFAWCSKDSLKRIKQSSLSVLTELFRQHTIPKNLISSSRYRFVSL